jgi:hypothetical protein
MALAERTDRESSLVEGRTALGETEFARAWAEGQAMTVEEAVAFALEDDGS